MKTIKGRAIILGQFTGTAALYDTWDGITKWASGISNMSACKRRILEAQRRMGEAMKPAQDDRPSHRQPRRTES